MIKRYYKVTFSTKHDSSARVVEIASKRSFFADPQQIIELANKSVPNDVHVCGFERFYG